MAIETQYIINKINAVSKQDNELMTAVDNLENMPYIPMLVFKPVYSFFDQSFTEEMIRIETSLVKRLEKVKVLEKFCYGLGRYCQS